LIKVATRATRAISPNKLLGDEPDDEPDDEPCDEHDDDAQVPPAPEYL